MKILINFILFSILVLDISCNNKQAIQEEQYSNYFNFVNEAVTFDFKSNTDVYKFSELSIDKIKDVKLDSISEVDKEKIFMALDNMNDYFKPSKNSNVYSKKYSGLKNDNYLVLIEDMIEGINYSSLYLFSLENNYLKSILLVSLKNNDIFSYYEVNSIYNNNEFQINEFYESDLVDENNIISDKISSIIKINEEGYIIPIK